MTKLPSKRSGILITTSLVIVLSISLYYLYTQNVKNDKINKQAFKTLYRYASDISEIENDLLAQYSEPIMIELSTINEAIYELKNKKKIYDSMVDIPSLFKGSNSSFIKTSSTKLNIEIKKLEERKLKIREDFRISVDSMANRNAWYLLEGIKYRVAKDNSKSDSVFVRKDKLFANVFDKMLFSDFLLFEDTALVYKTQSSPIDLKLISSLEYLTKSDSGRNVENAYISLLNNQKTNGFVRLANPSENLMQVYLAGESYQAFIIPIDAKGASHLVGLIPSSKYAALKRGFDRGLISAITIFIILLLLSIPVVKLMVVSPGEPFKIKSLITLLVSCVGTLFLVLFFSLYVSSSAVMRSHIIGKDEHLQQLSKTIKSGFDKEFKAMLDQLILFENKLLSYELDATKPNLYNYLNQVAGQEVNVETFEAEIKNIEKSSKKGYEKSIIEFLDNGPYPNWLEAFTALLSEKKTAFVVENKEGWIDSPTNIDIGKRDYIQNPERFKINDTLTVGFESIYSLNTSKPQVVVSKKDKTGKKAICISAEMYTLNDVVLPHGYSFCIIDKTGKVWFHQNPRNNLRENLFESTNHNPLLEAVIKSRRSNNITCDYKMKKNLMQVDPLDARLGLYLVTMCACNDYYQVFHQSGYMILASVLLIYSFWFLLALVFSWFLDPKKNSKHSVHGLLHFFPNLKHPKRYIQLTILNSTFLLLIMLFTFMLFDHVFVNHWVRIIALLGGGLLLMNMLSVKQRQTKLPLSIFLITTVSQILLFCIFEFILAGGLDTPSLFKSLAIILVTNAVAFVIFKFNLIKKYLKEDKLLDCYRCYYIYVFSFVLVVILIPLLTIYSVVYQQETTMYYMHQQRHVADKIIERENGYENQQKLSVKDILRAEGRYFGIMHNMVLHHPYDINDSSKKIIQNVEETKGKGKMTTTENYVKMFGDARSSIFFVNNKIEDRGNLIKPNYVSSSDRLYEYSIIDNQLCLKVSKGGYPPNNENFYLVMENFRNNRFNMGYVGLLIGLLLVALLFWFFFPRIGYYLFPQLKYHKDLFGETESKLLRNCNNGDLRYIVSMTDKEMYNECLSTPNSILYMLDKRSDQHNFSHYKQEDKDIYLFLEPQTFVNLNKLNDFVLKLEQIIRNVKGNNLAGNEVKPGSLTLVCFKSPIDLVKEIRENLHVNIEDEGTHLELDEAISRFQNCLADLSLSYLPIMTQPISNKIHNNEFPITPKWLNKEFGSNAFLRQKYKLLKSNSTFFHSNAADNSISDDKIYLIYLNNFNYYQKIWERCTVEEKSVLYDIAEDHMINMHKEGVVNELINKGLVDKKSYLSLFNKSFAHFVLHQSEEVFKINEALRAGHSSGWSQYNLPIKLLAAAILIFLFITQQEFLSSLQSIIISVGAILTFAIRFFNNPFKFGISSTDIK